MASTTVELYHDLCKEIDILELRIADLEHEFWWTYRAMINGNRKPLMRMDLALERMKQICDQVEVYATLLEEKEKIRKKIEQRISELESIDYKVCYLRDVKGMTLPEIAAELGYSYSWIKKISMRNKKGTKKEPCY